MQYFRSSQSHSSSKESACPVGLRCCSLAWMARGSMSLHPSSAFGTSSFIQIWLSKLNYCISRNVIDNFIFSSGSSHSNKNSNWNLNEREISWLVKIRCSENYKRAGSTILDLPVYFNQNVLLFAVTLILRCAISNVTLVFQEGGVHAPNWRGYRERGSHPQQEFCHRFWKWTWWPLSSPWDEISRRGLHIRYLAVNFLCDELLNMTALLCYDNTLILMIY